MVSISNTCVLAFDITPNGIGFAVLEGVERLYDSGMTYVSDKSKHAFLERAERLILDYQPHVLVLEDPNSDSFRKGPRASTIIKRIELLALVRVLPVLFVSQKEIRKAFGTKNKYETAKAVAEIFPVLEGRVPDYRRPWESEAERTNIYEAVSFALTAARKPLDLEDIPA